MASRELSWGSANGGGRKARDHEAHGTSGAGPPHTPQLSYPSTVLGRERAIVINLEHIKAVITAHEVLVLNSRDPTISPFVLQLQRSLNLRHGTRASRSHSENYGTLDYSDEDEGKVEMEEEGKSKEGVDLGNSNGPKALPFEFIALEACLEAACSCLELEVRDELEHLLDDDEDMAEMYLTNKLCGSSYLVGLLSLLN